MQGWYRPKGAADYSGVKDTRTVHGWIRDGLRHVRLPSGMILIKREWLDAFLEGHEVVEDTAVDKVVNEVMRDFK